MPTPNLKGLYVITDHALLGDALLEKAEQAITGGARILQYRDKTDDQQRRKTEAWALAQLCQQHDVTFLINDDVALAQSCQADGVHLGQQDTAVDMARQQLGKNKIIGVTCHADLQAAITAENKGADYVAFGRFFPSQTKPLAPPAEVNILTQARAQLHIPIVAIGGITIENGAQLIEAGADMLAVIHDIFVVTDSQLAAQQLAQLFS
ncbi:MAG: thiamine phosphate synthase [Gammaproteobacteria bacterium]|nr:thiamine phosphate synthase [Gammaproteobacteria bacterium]